jgi:hypothetical protein
MLSTIRAFVAKFLELHADEDRCDDIKLAVGEACSEMRGATTSVTLEIVGGHCSILCEGVGAPAAHDDGMRAELFGALAPNAVWSPDETVRFSLPLTT